MTLIDYNHAFDFRKSTSAARGATLYLFGRARDPQCWAEPNVGKKKVNFEEKSDSIRILMVSSAFFARWAPNRFEKVTHLSLCQLLRDVLVTCSCFLFCLLASCVLMLDRSTGEGER